MQPVNVLPAFVSQDTDLKSKDLSGVSADSNKYADFSSLVEQHLPEENKAISGKQTAETAHAATATQRDTIAVYDTSDVDGNSSQESDDKESLDTNNTSKENETDKDGLMNNTSIAESEQFISLLYNSDKTLTQGGNGQSDTVQSEKHESVVQASEHKLSGFSKDELFARAQLKNNNVATPQSSGQALKDYQLSLQSQQNAIKNQSITSEQLINTQLATAKLNNKMTDLATGVAQVNKNQSTEQVDTGLYQLPVEPIGKGDFTVDELSHSATESGAKGEVNQGENKASSLVQPKDGISAELADKATDIPSTKTANSSLESLNVNSDKVVVDRISQAATVENISKEQSVAAQEKQPVMTSAQLQALQQVQTQQKVQSVSSDQQVIDDAGEEFIDAMLLAEAKPIEQDVKTTGKVIDNIAMRTVSELQAQTVQATQTKQSDDAYLDHQVSEVLNHNVASDTAQIQKNNIQLQQETLSMTRKDFADAVKDKVMITINQKLQQFDITLDPPEFGNMQVRVNLQGEQATVNFVVQNQQAKDALEQNMHKLKDMLSEQGVDVGGANVEQQDQQQSQGEQSLGQNNDNGSALRNGAQKEEHNIDHILSAKLFDSSATGVDYYA